MLLYSVISTCTVLTLGRGFEPVRTSPPSSGYDMGIVVTYDTISGVQVRVRAVLDRVAAPSAAKHPSLLTNICAEGVLPLLATAPFPLCARTRDRLWPPAMVG